MVIRGNLNLPSLFIFILDRSVSRPLPTHFDLLLDSNSIRDKEMERITIHEKKKSNYDLAKKIAETNILLGEKDKAIDMLLGSSNNSANSNNNNSTSYLDGLKAAVIAASISPSSFSKTVSSNSSVINIRRYLYSSSPIFYYPSIPR